jgi:hypothetical protein
VPYGRLNDRQRKALAKHVRGKIVHDLGAGDLELSQELLKLGASEVYAIDKEARPRRFLTAHLHYKESYFKDVKSRMDTLFLSWPVNREADLGPHLTQALSIIYLGCNTGGSACGTPSLFKALLRRELLDYEPDRWNSLVIVGKPIEGPRLPTGEELAGLGQTSGYYSFEEAEAHAG